MPTINITVTEEFRDTLADMLSQEGIKNRSDYILSLIQADAKSRGYLLPPAIAPWGVRQDALPQNTDGGHWKSRLYSDRYQIVAVWNGKGFEFSHLHEFGVIEQGRIFDTLRADEVISGDGR
jgi:hypothetical protein